MIKEDFLVELLKKRKGVDNSAVCAFCAEEFGKLPGLYLTNKVCGVSPAEYSMEFTWPGKGDREPVILHAWIDDIQIPKAYMHTPTDEGTWGVEGDFSPMIVSGNVYGTGAVMGKGGAAVIYELMSYLAANAIHFPFDLKILLSIGHREDACGIQKLLEGTKARAALLVEPTCGKIAPYSAKVTWMNLWVEGVSCHTVALAAGLNKDGKSTLYELLDSIQAKHDEYGKKSANASIKSSFNVGGMYSGRWASTGARADAKVAVYSEASADADKFIEDIKSMAADAGAFCSVALERCGGAKKSADKLFSALAESAEAYGMSGKEFGMPGITDLEFFEKAGVPAVCFGPGDYTLAGTTEEHMSADAMADAANCIKAWLERM